MSKKHEQLTDWREDPDVVRARERFEDLDQRVRAADARSCELIRQQERAEQAVALARAAQSKEGSLVDVVDAKRRLASVEAEIKELEAGVGTLFDEHVAARTALAAAEKRAKGATWPGDFAEYLEAKTQHDACLEAAVATEARVVEIFQRLLVKYGGSGWIDAPGGKVGNARFSVDGRPLTEGALLRWRQHCIQAGIATEQETHRAEADRQAEERRREVERLAREASMLEIAEAERTATRWYSTRDLGSPLVKTRIQGGPMRGGPNQAA